MMSMGYEALCVLVLEHRQRLWDEAENDRLGALARTPPDGSPPEKRRSRRFALLRLPAFLTLSALPILRR
jgi:hypothetical protein